VPIEWSDRLGLDDALRFLEDAHAYGIGILGLTGGEPFWLRGGEQAEDTMTVGGPCGSAISRQDWASLAPERTAWWTR
jgi:hypothetical protein